MNEGSASFADAASIAGDAPRVHANELGLMERKRGRHLRPSEHRHPGRGGRHHDPDGADHGK
ncbi:MAG: hypothetical protein V8S34_09135 [Lawsonibacter sp.]